MAKRFARDFKQLMQAQPVGDTTITGTVLSLRPLRISCYDGRMLFDADVLQISNHVNLHVGDDVALSGKNPYTVMSVLSDADPDEYEPPQAVIIDDALSDTSENPVQNKVVTEAISGASAALEEIKSSVAILQASLSSAVSEHDSINAQIEQVKAAMHGISTSLDGYVSKSGDTISGDLTVAGKINDCTICDRETIGGTFVYGGSVVLDSTSNGQMWAAAHPSYVGSIKDDGIWYNCLSIRHQNGSGDGNLYGMRIWSPMTSAGSLIWQQQIGASAGWGTAKTILDTSNFGQKKTLSAVGASGWTNNATDDLLIPSMSMVAYWNGAYSGTSSNLRYCANGEMIGTNNLSSKLPAAAPGTKGGAQMISGMLTPGTVSAGGYLDYTYTFTSGTFSGTPTIVACTIESDAGTSASGNAARKVIVKSRSTTSVTFRLYNNSSSSWSPKIAYIGIYRG